MEVIDIPLEGQASADGLRAFLGACLQKAEEDNRARIASINMAVRHIDPLAVLDSIYEPGSHHFYQENPQREWAVAGAESVFMDSWSGAGRFQSIKAFAADVDSRVISIGDRNLPFYGPLVFCGLTFYEDRQGPDEPFPPAMAFVPRWQVARFGSDYLAVANALISPGMDIEPVVLRIWSAYEKFTHFDYQQPPVPPVYRITAEREVGPPGSYAENVSTALRRIDEGKYGKIVLARAVDLVFDNPCYPIRILHRLRREYARCSAFSLQNDDGCSFIGATPERLVSVREGHYFTEAIAGSAPRGASASEDARLADALLRSDKDLREHRLVSESIERRLAGIGLYPEFTDRPGLLSLPNVQHLRTPITGQLGPGLHLLDLAETLHPTPAVGGSPREAALPDIAALEPFSRGLFAGLLGWFDLSGNGEFSVGIRSARVQGRSARVYAGAGILNGSDPELEYQETSLKMQALLASIRGATG
jgi:menaquinone-specific isochorismate synthase